MIGPNSDYLAHPEELMADNFALLLTRRARAPDPRAARSPRALARRAGRELMRHEGRCHCGAIRFAFETAGRSRRAPASAAFAAGTARAPSADPAGSAALALGPDTIRYRFGSRTTDFLICGRCGVYVGADRRARRPALRDPQPQRLRRSASSTSRARRSPMTARMRRTKRTRPPGEMDAGANSELVKCFRNG